MLHNTTDSDWVSEFDCSGEITVICWIFRDICLWKNHLRLTVWWHITAPPWSNIAPSINTLKPTTVYRRYGCFPWNVLNMVMRKPPCHLWSILWPWFWLISSNCKFLVWQGVKIMLILCPQKVAKIGGAVIELNNHGQTILDIWMIYFRYK
jgi:hypothetical protein